MQFPKKISNPVPPLVPDPTSVRVFVPNTAVVPASPTTFGTPVPGIAVFPVTSIPPRPTPLPRHVDLLNRGPSKPQATLFPGIAITPAAQNPVKVIITKFTTFYYLFHVLCSCPLFFFLITLLTWSCLLFVLQISAFPSFDPAYSSFAPNVAVPVSRHPPPSIVYVSVPSYPSAKPTLPVAPVSIYCHALYAVFYFQFVLFILFFFYLPLSGRIEVSFYPRCF